MNKTQLWFLEDPIYQSLYQIDPVQTNNTQLKRQTIDRNHYQVNIPNDLERVIIISCSLHNTNCSIRSTHHSNLYQIYFLYIHLITLPKSHFRRPRDYHQSIMSYIKETRFFTSNRNASNSVEIPQKCTSLFSYRSSATSHMFYCI